MISKRGILTYGIVVCLFLFFGTSSPVNSADTTAQIITQVDEILKENPLKAGEKVQTIKIAEDDTVTFFLTRMGEGFELKPHVHKTHDESVYVIKGTGQMLVNDKWVGVKAGSIHFNPIGKVHSTKNTGNEPLVIISIFTPRMKEPDRHFVE
jgi:mannose-6-phosphate isomerase-like protein (cupin superfamily)